MKFLHEKIEFNLTNVKEGFTLENLLTEIHSIYGKEQISIIQHNENEVIFKFPTHTRVGNTRVRHNLESKLLICQIYEHYTAFVLFIYLLIIGAMGYFYGILSNLYGLLFIAVFAYFLWILIDNHYTSKKRIIEVTEKYLLR